MRVADYIFEFVASLGVRDCFLLPGGGAMHLVDALGSNDQLNYIAMHHEQAAAIAAEAYSRVNENIGVALVTTGPGGLNALTAVGGAWIESVPLLIISGQVKRDDLVGDNLWHHTLCPQLAEIRARAVGESDIYVYGHCGHCDCPRIRSCLCASPSTDRARQLFLAAVGGRCVFWVHLGAWRKEPRGSPSFYPVRGARRFGLPGINAPTP